LTAQILVHALGLGVGNEIPVGGSSGSGMLVGNEIQDEISSGSGSGIGIAVGNEIHEERASDSVLVCEGREYGSGSGGNGGSGLRALGRRGGG